VVGLPPASIVAVGFVTTDTFTEPEVALHCAALVMTTL
jgi:hypothetical protein